MSHSRPHYMDSEWYYEDAEGNGRLREGAPQALVEEYIEYTERVCVEVPELYLPRALTDADLRDD